MGCISLNLVVFVLICLNAFWFGMLICFCLLFGCFGFVLGFGCLVLGCVCWCYCSKIVLFDVDDRFFWGLLVWKFPLFRGFPFKIVYLCVEINLLLYFYGCLCGLDGYV